MKHGEIAIVEAEPTAKHVLAALQAKGIDVGPCRLAVNLSFVIGDQDLGPSDELALIPPVSGG